MLLLLQGEAAAKFQEEDNIACGRIRRCILICVIWLGNNDVAHRKGGGGKGALVMSIRRRQIRVEEAKQNKGRNPISDSSRVCF